LKHNLHYARLRINQIVESFTLQSAIYNCRTSPSLEQLFSPQLSRGRALFHVSIVQIRVFFTEAGKDVSMPPCVIFRQNYSHKRHQGYIMHQTFCFGWPNDAPWPFDWRDECRICLCHERWM